MIHNIVRDLKSYLVDVDWTQDVINKVASICETWIKPEVVVKETFIKVNDTLKKPSNIPQIVDQVLDIVCEYFGVEKEGIISSKRTHNLVMARHICFFILRNRFNLTLSEIGLIFRRDHTTIMHGITNVNNGIFCKDMRHEHLKYLNAEIIERIQPIYGNNILTKASKENRKGI